MNIDIIGGGEIGGKSKGFFKAKDILCSDEFKKKYPNEAGLLRYPASFCIGTGVYKILLKGINLINYLRARKPV